MPAIDESAVAHLKTAIEALEKLMPKKAIVMDCTLCNIDFRCPACKSEYICEKEYEHFYCPNCGRKFGI